MDDIKPVYSDLKLSVSNKRVKELLETAERCKYNTLSLLMHNYIYFHQLISDLYTTQWVMAE